MSAHNRRHFYIGESYVIYALHSEAIKLESIN